MRSSCPPVAVETFSVAHVVSPLRTKFTKAPTSASAIIVTTRGAAGMSKPGGHSRHHTCQKLKLMGRPNFAQEDWWKSMLPKRQFLGL